MFIVITGLDGSGTSTVAEKLAERDNNSVILKTPSNEYGDREIIDCKVRKYSPVGHFLYYLSSTVYMSDYIKANFDYKNNNVYCVRYLIDTFVSNKVAGIPVKFDYSVFGNELLKPDLTIFVGLDENVREKRITKRGKSELDKVLDDSKVRNSFLEEFKNALSGEKVYFFDNTSKNMEEGIDKLLKYIKDMQ